MDFNYRLVDVFTERPLEGNALAVFPDARGLSLETMQRIARELNLSETAFVVPGQRDGASRVRIFTPSSEMDFAGHPTIGTAYVLRDEGLVPADATSVVLRENVGDVVVRVEGGIDPAFWLTTPPIAFEGAFSRRDCANAVSLTESDLIDGLPCELLSAGNPNIFVPLKSVETVDRANIDSAALSTLVSARSGPTCLFIFAPTKDGAYSRMFAPQLGVIEDPATGSATGPLALYMMRHGLVSSDDGTRFVSVQGAKMRRRSELSVLVHGAAGCNGIEVGGRVSPIARGTMTLGADVG